MKESQVLKKVQVGVGARSDAEVVQNDVSKASAVSVRCFLIH